MKFSAAILGFALLAQSVSGHYIFNELIAGSKTSTKAVRQPQSNSPVHDYLSNDIRCNIDPSTASETVSVAAGSKIGFNLGENKKIYHLGPVDIYLGKAPGKAQDWDGSGKNWFKIAEWGATFNPFSFKSLDKSRFTTTIPKDTPSGEYLVRIEQIGLHLTGTPEFFISCAQIKVTNGGDGNPAKVSIPGVYKKTDPSLNVDIYWPIPTSYDVPGPEVWRG
ncbi:glycoside hydrolase family 61 protein [Crucibulum laeve]|uniref:AA9 family lytic polysaccharide monooxygenase n=1 Tax=Crucibulum laeve TaxID=68775 RepID=A0A5C3MB62_9AGAR|nr:glycoside hydrolase family 61 protein [Crucibulum laeve]